MTIEEAVKLKTTCEREIAGLLNGLIKSTGLKFESCDVKLWESISSIDVAEFKINMKL